MVSTTITSYEVNVYDDERWNLDMTCYYRKTALARAELLNKEGKKWCIWKRSERSEMIGRG